MRIAIVGGGAAGVAVAHALTEKLDLPFSLTVFDRAFENPHKAGRGLPYVSDGAEPLLNAPARYMSVSQDCPGHFEQWHERHFAHRVHGDLYVTRPTFGKYLSDTLDELRHHWAARPGLLHYVPQRVIDISREADGTLTVGTDGVRHLGVDYVVLCTGWDGAAASVSSTGPYPLAKTIEAVRAGASVAIAGSGLTGVDVARGLLRSGYCGRIVMASRRGILPSVRSTAELAELRYFTAELLETQPAFTVTTAIASVLGEASSQGVDITVPRRIFRGELSPAAALHEAVRGADNTWSALFVRLADAVASGSWHRFDSTNRRVFMRLLHPFFQAWANPMPPSTASELLSAIDSGQLEVRSGVRQFGPAFVDYADRRTEHFSTTVRAYGSGPLSNVRTGLLADLISKGMAQPDPYGGLKVEYRSSRVLDAAGNPHAMYAVGALVQGARYYVSALDGIVRTAGEIARDIRQRIGAHSVPVSSGAAAAVIS